jgi:NifU-like protein involved in Fe-S cluster formation
MSDSIYDDPIMRLARAATGSGILPDAQATATADNPLCGDRVTVQLSLERGRIAQFAHRVRGCALCQAVASMIGKHALACTPSDIAAAGEAARKLLKERAAPPAGAWPELADFAPVADHKSRHTCVLLAFDAVAKAAAAAPPA